MWTTHKILKLIEDLRCSPCLWDSRHVDYRNRAAKNEAYQALGRKYGVNPMEIVKKFQILRTQFRRELRKVESMRKNSTWFGYEPLLFLDYDTDESSEDQNIFVSLSEYEAAAVAAEQGNSSIVFKRETSENETVCDTMIMEAEPQNLSTTSDNFEISVIEDSTDSLQQQPLRYARKTTTSNRANPWSRDEFAVYGEHVANKLRNCGRSRLEIAMAQHEIDNICFRLTMGVYKQHLQNIPLSVARTVNDENEAGGSEGNVSSATAQE